MKLKIESGVLKAMDRDVLMPERIFTSICFAIVGAIIGLISRTMSGTVTVFPFSALAADVGPWMFLTGLFLAILGYAYPRKLGWLLCLLPAGCELS